MFLSKYYHIRVLIIFIYCLSLLLSSCASVKEVQFENYIDTTQKAITFQQKKTFALNELGVFASNEFDGARLNDFKRVN